MRVPRGSREYFSFSGDNEAKKRPVIFWEHGVELACPVKRPLLKTKINVAFKSAQPSWHSNRSFVNSFHDFKWIYNTRHICWDTNPRFPTPPMLISQLQAVARKILKQRRIGGNEKRDKLWSCNTMIRGHSLRVPTKCSSTKRESQHESIGDVLLNLNPKRAEKINNIEHRKLRLAVFPHIKTSNVATHIKKEKLHLLLSEPLYSKQFSNINFISEENWKPTEM